MHAFGANHPNRMSASVWSNFVIFCNLVVVNMYVRVGESQIYTYLSGLEAHRLQHSSTEMGSGGGVCQSDHESGILQ